MSSPGPRYSIISVLKRKGLMLAPRVLCAFLGRQRDTKTRAHPPATSSDTADKAPLGLSTNCPQQAHTHTLHTHTHAYSARHTVIVALVTCTLGLSVLPLSFHLSLPVSRSLSVFTLSPAPKSAVSNDHNILWFHCHVTQCFKGPVLYSFSGLVFFSPDSSALYN